MPLDIEEFLHGIGQIADNEKIRFTVKQSGKGALVCGGLCFVGGLLAGPVGMAVGGTLGGLTAYRMTGNFRSVCEIINNDMTVREKEKLYEHLVNTVRQLHPTDIAMLLPLVTSSASIQQAVIKSLVSFLTNEMSYSIANSR